MLYNQKGIYEMKKYLRIAAVVACLIPLQALAALYGTILDASNSAATSTLVELDPATGAVLNTIGAVGYRINGTTYDATTGTMYATTSSSDPSFPDGLITINLTTGVATEIGTGAGQLVNVPAANSSGALYGWTEDGDDPVLWDKAAGTVTVLGDAGFSSSRQSLAFDDSDTLYYVDRGEIRIIDTTTGISGAPLAPTGLTGADLHHGDFSSGTTLYAITERGLTNPRQIDILDVTTGIVSSTISAPDNLHTLAFTDGAGGGSSTPVPTMTIYGLVLTMLGLLLVASRRLRASAKRT
ncbi:MAG: hypothetical protein ACI8QT_000893 [Halioglobus sp.]